MLFSWQTIEKTATYGILFCMNHEHSTLPDDPAELKKIILDIQKQSATLEAGHQKVQSALQTEINYLNEQIRVLRQTIFGPTSEKRDLGDSPQLLLFDMPENIPENLSAETEELEEIVVPEHNRKKKGRKKLPEDLPRVDVVHDLAEEEKICACGCELSRIGEEISEKLDIVPAKIQVIRNIRPKYACKKCEGLEDDGPSVKITPVPAQIIPKGLATAGLLAYVLTAKFVDALPFYRQEKQFRRIGIELPRTTMCGWAMKAAEACLPLMSLLKEEIRGGPIINVDESTVQVLHEPGRSPTQKSYMWIFKGGLPDRASLIYEYHPTRSGDVAKLFLDGYQGAVQTDGYKGYDFLDKRQDVLHVGCWAHARRKFMDVKKASSSKKAGSYDKALRFIKHLYALEKVARQKEMSGDEVYEWRQKQAKPILEKFKTWLNKKSSQVAPKSLFGKAISYCLAQWHRLENYIKAGHAGIDNNVAENAIRPFVVGRKNWLFSGTPAGARASAVLYSLIETAKANKLEPYSYLRYLFEKLPSTSPDDLLNLLPHNLSAEKMILPSLPSGV